jgi:signal transduction histidine kinase
MSLTPHTGGEPRISRVSRIAALLVSALGGIVLFGGWALDIDVLKSGGGNITMKANSALAMLAAGLSLWALASGSQWIRPMGVACAVLSGAVGTATLSQHVFGWNLGIDELLFVEPPGAAATASPNRMGPNASLSFSLYSVALLYLYRADPARVARAQMLAAIGTVLAVLPIVGYAYGAEELYQLARLSGIALHTAIALLILAIGILAARPHEGPVAVLVSRGAGGMVARRLVIPSLVLPALLGYAWLSGARAGLYDIGMEASLSVTSLAVILWVVIWRTSVLLDRVDRERAAALENERAARADAEQATRLKDEFLAALSHELRTPLNAVLGWTSLLQQGTIPAEQTTRATQMIARNGERLGRLVEDLLDISRIASGHLTLRMERVDMNEVVDGALAALAPAAAARNITLEWSASDEAVVVAGEAARLEQIVRNLLSNSIKFTDAGGSVSVAAKTIDGTVELRVTDTGCGIDPAFLPYVFDRFRQGDSSSTRPHEGLGLGLSIVRELTLLHGGNAVASSGGTGRGTSVTITLPRTR